MDTSIKDTQMPPLASPQRRKRVHTEDNIRIPNVSSASNLKKIRINTLQNEEDVLQRENSVRRLTFKPNLSPIKYYQTKLTLSCEAWSVFSIQQGKYKRGWHPNKSVEFNGLIRMVVAKTYFDLLRDQPQIEPLMVRVNKYLLADEQKNERKSMRELIKLKHCETEDHFFAENTIVLLRDLIKGMIISNSNELLYYSTHFLGYLLAKLQESSEYFRFHHQHAVISSYAQGALLVTTFIDYSNEDFKKKYSETYITNAFELISTPNELSQYFAELIADHKKILTILETKEFTSVIRYQVGFKFYEDRSKRFLSDRVHPTNHVVVSSRGKNNFGVISYNKLTSQVIVLYDCKFSMADIDINRIEQWLKSVSKPIGGEGRRAQSKILPLLKLLQ